MGSEIFEYNALARVFAAYWVSEIWHSDWVSKRGCGSKTPTYCRARAMVLHDRVLTDRDGPKRIKE